jgi:hypothetical protein
MRNRCPAFALFLLAALGIPTKSTADFCQDMRDAGDTLRVALPAAAYALTALHSDKEGAYQYTKQLAFTGIATQTFKLVAEKTRPDARTSTQSFVSGHVSAAMSGASFIYTRYGKGMGIPAYALGFLTMYSRVCAQKHFSDDVLGGAMVAMMSNWYFTSPHPDSTRIYPGFNSNGLEISWSTMFGGSREPRDPINFKPRYRTVFEFGPLVQDKNIVRSPNPGGTTIDLEALEEEFHYTARFIFERYLTDKHTFSVWYGPMGMTEFGSPQTVFTVGDTTFDPSDPDAFIFDSNYRWWDLRLGYKYTIVNNEKWKAKVGLSVQYSITEFEVEQRNDEAVIVKNGHAKDESVAPLIHGSLAFKFNDRWSIETEIDGISNGDEYYWNSGLYLRFRPTQLWDLAVGGRAFSVKVDTVDFFNELEFFDFSLQIGRSF